MKDASSTAAVSTPSPGRGASSVGARGLEREAQAQRACRATALRGLVKGTVIETILSYHAGTVPLGALAERAGVQHLVLTHLIPAPRTEAEEEGFAQDVRSGGYTGRVTVGRDLTTIEIDRRR